MGTKEPGATGTGPCAMLGRMPIELLMANGWSHGHLCMQMDVITVTEHGQEIGTIGNAMGVGVVITDKATGDYWRLSAASIWNAFAHMRETTDLAALRAMGPPPKEEK